MPYITKDRRNEVMRFVDNAPEPMNAGELNYVLTITMLEYVQRKGLSYQTLNDIAGALENAKTEFYRRVVVPYEEDKRRNNGDIAEYVTVRQT